MTINPSHLDRIRECFPALALSSVRANLDGLVNDVVIVNEELVFRFPKNDHWARELLTNEIRVLDLIRPRVNLPVPQFEHQSADFVVYRLIPGDALQRHDILRLN